MLHFISTCFWIPNKLSFCLAQKLSSAVGPGWSPSRRSLEESRCSTEPISWHHWITMVSIEYNSVLSIRHESELHTHTQAFMNRLNVRWEDDGVTHTEWYLSCSSSFLSTHSGRGSRIWPWARPLSVTAWLRRCSRCLQMSCPTTRGQTRWFNGHPISETNTCTSTRHWEPPKDIVISKPELFIQFTWEMMIGV